MPSNLHYTILSLNIIFKYLLQFFVLRLYFFLLLLSCSLSSTAWQQFGFHVNPSRRNLVLLLLI